MLELYKRVQMFRLENGIITGPIKNEICLALAVKITNWLIRNLRTKRLEGTYTEGRCSITELCRIYDRERCLFYLWNIL